MVGRMSGEAFILLFLIFIVNNLNGQTHGKVTDQTNGAPIKNATLTDSSSGDNAIADENGVFTFTNTVSDITVRALGYKTENIKISQSFTHIGLTPSYYELNQVVVKAIEDPISLQKLPGSLTILLSKDLKMSEQVSFSPLLNQVPGLFMHSGTLNTSRISIRGIGSRTPYSTTGIKAYLNNIPLTSGDGETVIEDIDPSLIERVDVFKGPASSLYGAALGGTLSFLVRDGGANSSWVEASTDIGEYGLLSGRIHANIARNGKNLTISANQTSFEGFRQNSEYNRSSFLLTGEVSINNWTVKPLILYTKLNAEIPSSIDSFTWVNNPTAAAASWLKTKGNEKDEKLLGGINFVGKINAINVNSSFFSGYRIGSEARPFNFLDENSYFAGTRNVLNVLFLKKLRVAAGFELYSERFNFSTSENIDGEGRRGELASDNREIKVYSNIFTQIGIEITPSLFVLAGINANQTRYVYKDIFSGDSIDFSGNYTFNPIFSPRIGLTYYKTLFSTFVSISHGFTPPLLSETLTPDGQINPNIKPERGWNYEMGIKFNFLENALQGGVSVFTIHIHDLLVAQRVGPDAYVGVNAGFTKHTGLEASVNYRRQIVGTNFIPYFFGSFSLSSFKFDGFIDKGYDLKGNFLPGIPKETFYGGMNLEFLKIGYINLNFRYVGQMFLQDKNLTQSKAYGIAALRIGSVRNLGKSMTLEIFAGVNNLLDEHYASMILVNAPSFGKTAPRYYYPGMPRQFNGGISLRYLFPSK